MNKGTMVAFYQEIEKDASIGSLLASNVSRIASATSPIRIRLGKLVNTYFPTFKKHTKNIASGIGNALAMGATGAVGLGGYAVYKGLKEPPEANMSGQ